MTCRSGTVLIGNDRVARSYERDAHRFPSGQSGVVAGAGPTTTGSVFEFLERFDLVPHQAVAAVRAIHDASVGWAPHRPAASLYLCLEQVQYLATGTPLTWGRTYFIEDRFQFVIVRSSSTSSAFEDRNP